MGNHEQELNKEAGEVEEAFEPQTKDFAAALVHLEIYEIEPEKSYRVELTKKQGFFEPEKTDDLKMYHAKCTLSSAH